MTARETIESFRTEEATKRRASERNRLASMDEMHSTDEWKAKELLPRLRDATRCQYETWLEGYIEVGGQPTHSYDYPFSGFKIAVADFHLRPLYGAQAEHIIVPAGVSFTTDGLGHGSLYFMDGFSCLGGWVPVYSDILASD